MRFSTPHPIPYQGSKRRLAPAILAHIPQGRYLRLVEPFAGSAAITLAAARQALFQTYVIGDVLEPLVGIWQQVIQDPSRLARQYSELWNAERRNPIQSYYDIRSQFNRDRSPAKLLYLLVRCVKNAVRFNPAGEFNQSPDKRRTGMKPQLMAAELLAAHRLLYGKATALSGDYLKFFEEARPSDLFYLDPPYQGTSEGRDRRYVTGVPRAQLLEGLEVLNRKGTPFILSYDGSCGDRTYGDPLPGKVAEQILIDAGRSSQSTLSGRAEQTVESIYVSRLLSEGLRIPRTLSLKDFNPQSELFAPLH